MNEFTDPFAEQVETLASEDEERARTARAEQEERDTLDKLSSEEIPENEETDDRYRRLWGDAPEGGDVASPLTAFERIFDILDELGQAVEHVLDIEEHTGFVAADEGIEIGLNVVEATVVDCALQIFGLIGNERARQDAEAISRKLTDIVLARRDSKEYEEKMAPYLVEYEEAKAKQAKEFQASLVEQLQAMVGEGVQVLSEEEFAATFAKEATEIDASSEAALDFDLLDSESDE